ncbi:MAG TPA: hypothetical protein PKA63_05960 [Oligoflexia bacterium]|nr:hypothetical protein [Oligoflexia bacterium]HMP48195.1 hypothetical protein [Oligoflexia bacterium]
MSVGPDILSAGTLVAAVLEQAGLMTQGYFISNFRGFFRDAGALFYFIAAIGGVISVLMFGSFRAARYLILGPAFYWFLVGPTTDIRGVVAQIGDGQPRGIMGNKGEEASLNDNQKVNEKAGDDTREIKVAKGFWLFAKPINDIVNEFVGVMLKNEDGEDLMVASKVRGLETIARMMPAQTDFIHILEDDILKNCLTSYASANGAAGAYIKQRVTEGIISTPNTQELPKLRSVFQEKSADYLRNVENKIIQVNTTFYLRNLIKTHGEAGDSEALRAKQYYNESLKDAEVNISCSAAWDILLEHVWLTAAKTSPNILALASGEWGVGGEQAACRDLTAKLFDDKSPGNQSSGKCDLRPGIAMALLWNHLSRVDTFQRVLQRHDSSGDPMNPKSHTITALMEAGNMTKNLLNGFTSLFLPEEMTTDLGGKVKLTPLQSLVADARDKVNATIDYGVTATFHLIQGITHSEQVSMPIYEMTRVRQKIFSWAMNIPYYQGLLLYFIAIAYPFAALLVLLPGRAMNFFNIPLAWLWVKSWDIGYAGVTLLERVMYNLLPNWSLPLELRNGPWNYKQLPVILGEGYNFSHVQGIAYHYTVISMVMLAVPAIMGTIILKGRKAVLSSFTDAVESKAVGSSMRGAASHSIAAANERSQMMIQIKGFAQLSTALEVGGLEGGTKGASAMGHAVLGGLSKAPQKMMEPGANLSAKTKQLLDSSKDISKEMLGTYQTMVEASSNFESMHKGNFHPVFGRWGVLQSNNDAYTAALDGSGARLSGGFETNDPTANSIEELLGMMRAQHDSILSAQKNLSYNLGYAAGSLANPKSLGIISGALLGANPEVITDKISELLGAEGNNSEGSRKVYEFYANIFMNTIREYGAASGFSEQDLLKSAITVVPGVDYSALQNENTLYGAIYRAAHGQHLAANGLQGDLPDSLFSTMGGNRQFVNDLMLGTDGKLYGRDGSTPFNIGETSEKAFGAIQNSMLETSPISRFFNFHGFAPDTMSEAGVISSDIHYRATDPAAYANEIKTMQTEISGYLSKMGYEPGSGNGAPVTLAIEDIYSRALAFESARGDSNAEGLPGGFHASRPSNISPELLNQAPRAALKLVHEYFRETERIDFRDYKELEVDDRNNNSPVFEASQIMNRGN